MPKQRWSKEETAMLVAGYANLDISVPELAVSMGRTEQCLRQKAHRLEITKKHRAKPVPPPPPRRPWFDWRGHAEALRQRGINEATVAAMLAQVGIR